MHFTEEEGLSLDDLFGLPLRLYKHIFHGKHCRRGGVIGVHHKEALVKDSTNIQKGDIRISQSNNISKSSIGYYSAQISYYDGEQWVEKTYLGQPAENGFFPDHWNIREVMQEILETKEKINISDWLPPLLPKKKSNTYVKSSPSGQKLMFFLGNPQKSRPQKVPKYIASVFPVFG